MVFLQVLEAVPSYAVERDITNLSAEVVQLQWSLAGLAVLAVVGVLIGVLIGRQYILRKTGCYQTLCLSWQSMELLLNCLWPGMTLLARWWKICTKLSAT